MRVSVLVFNASHLQIKIKSHRMHKALEDPYVEHAFICDFHQYTLIVFILDHCYCGL